MDLHLREGADTGIPLVVSDPSAPAATALREVARSLSHRRRGLAGRSLDLTPAAR
jgi:ATP-binding protein involved in chromosome partitioning